MNYGYLAGYFGRQYNVTSNNADLGNGASGERKLSRSPSFFCY
jgi:hypothetical protein